MAKTKSLGILGVDNTYSSLKEITSRNSTIKPTKGMQYYDNGTLVGKKKKKKDEEDVRTVKTEDTVKKNTQVNNTPNKEGYIKTNQKYGYYDYHDYKNKKDFDIYKKDGKAYYYDPRNKTYNDMDTPYYADPTQDKKELKEAKKYGYKERKTYKTTKNGKRVEVLPNTVAERVELETSGLTKKEKKKYAKSLIKQKDKEVKKSSYVREGGTLGELKYMAKSLKENTEPLGRVKEAYDYGKIQQEMSLAYSDMLKGKKVDISKIQRKIDNYNKFNKDVAEANTMLDTYVKSVPGQLRGMKKGVENAGALGTIGAIGGGTIGAVATKTPQGAVAGAETGAKWLGGTGYVKGQAQNTYELESGATYQTLLEMGVPDKIARKEAKRVGTENALIESGESILDLLTFGRAGAATTALKEGLLKKYGAEALKKWGVSYGTNIVSEGLQEGTQEQRSIAAEKRAAEKAGIERDDSQDVQRILESAKAGGFGAALTGAGTRITGMGGSSVYNMTKQKTSQMLEIQQQVNNGTMTHEEANQKIEQVNNGTYDKNKVLDEIATQKRDEVEQAAQQGIISPAQATQEIQALNNTLVEEREQISRDSKIEAMQETIQQMDVNGYISKNYTNEQLQEFMDKVYDDNLSTEELQQNLYETIFNDAARKKTVEALDISAKDTNMTRDEFIKRNYNKSGEQELNITKEDIGKIYDKYHNEDKKSVKEKVKNIELVEPELKEIPIVGDVLRTIQEPIMKKTGSDKYYTLFQISDTGKYAKDKTKQRQEYVNDYINKMAEKKETTKEKTTNTQQVSTQESTFNNEQKPKNVGVHYGNLGKARDTYHWNINSSNRSTGHYGTGTYFVSNEESNRMQNSSFTRSDRPRNEVDFDDYNLYKPLIESEAKRLHDGLKAVNYNKYDDFDYRVMVDDLKRNGITQEQIDNAKNAVEEARQQYEKEGYNDKYDAEVDSLSTVFMKNLGFDGIDVRGLEGYDNTSYGSVIYDLKNNNVKTNKNENIPATKSENVISAKINDGTNIELKKNKDNTYTKEIKQPKDNKSIVPKEVMENQIAHLEDGTKLSNFYSNITEKSKFITEENREKLSQEDIWKFAPQTNKETMQKALDKIGNTQKSLEAAYGDFLSKENFDPEDVAMGWVFLKRFQDAGNYDAMVQVAKKMRNTGATKTGRTLQMFNLQSRLTPEGMVYYAQSELSEAKQKYDKGKSLKQIEKHAEDFTLTPTETEYIQKQMEKIQTMEDGREKNIELAKINKMLSDKLPHTKGDSLRAWMRIAMLFNPKTQVRNLGGNAMITPVNAIADVPAAIADKAISKFTGVRTIGAPSLGGAKAYAKGFVKGGKEAIQDYKMDIDTKNVDISRFDITQKNPFKTDHKGIAKPLNLSSKVLNKTNKILDLVMSGGDRTFYQGAFENSLRNQMKLNKVDTPTQDMIDIAIQEGLSRTWNDNNDYTNFVLTTRRALNKFSKNGLGSGYGLGDVLIPFAKTPANLTKAIVDYSPVGLTSTIFKTKNIKNAIQTGQITPQIQHEFAQNLGKGVAGTMLYGIAVALAKAGLASGSSDDDKDVADFVKNTMGIQPYSITINGKSFTYDWAQPIAAPLAIATDAYKNLSGESNEDALSRITNTILDVSNTGLNVLMQQSFLSGMAEVFNNQEGITNGMMEQVFDLPARGVPTFLKQINDMFDKTQRVSYERNHPLTTSKQSAMSKIPGQSEKLAPKVDTLGREIQKYGGDKNTLTYALKSFLSPSNRSNARTSKVANEIYEVYSETGDKNMMPRVAPYYIGQSKENRIDLNSKQRAEYQKTSGKLVNEAISDLITNQKYQNLSYDDKAQVINKIVGFADAKAKESFTGKISNYYAPANRKISQGMPIADYYLNSRRKKR